MGPRILIVEDEENVAYVISTALRLAGFAISETSSGREALRLASEDDSPDLIVLDVQLPDLNGFEVCRRLRSAGRDHATHLPHRMLTPSTTGSVVSRLEATTTSPSRSASKNSSPECT